MGGEEDVKKTVIVVGSRRSILERQDRTGIVIADNAYFAKLSDEDEGLWNDHSAAGTVAGILWGI
jgi:hypothetical protein